MFKLLNPPDLNELKSTLVSGSHLTIQHKLLFSLAQDLLTTTDPSLEASCLFKQTSVITLLTVWLLNFVTELYECGKIFHPACH